jgi:hypothetical protein
MEELDYGEVVCQAHAKPSAYVAVFEQSMRDTGIRCHCGEPAVQFQLDKEPA